MSFASLISNGEFRLEHDSGASLHRMDKERRARESGVESLYLPLMNRARLTLSLDSPRLVGHVSDEKADREAFTLYAYSCLCLGGYDRHTHTNAHTRNQHTCTDPQIYTHIHMYAYTNMHTFVCTHTCTDLQTYICTQTHMQILSPADWVFLRMAPNAYFDPWVGKIPWRRAWQPNPGFLAWEIPRTEEPGGLQSMGLQRVRQDRATKRSTAPNTWHLTRPDSNCHPPGRTWGAWKERFSPSLH